LNFGKISENHSWSTLKGITKVHQGLSTLESITWILAWEDEGKLELNRCIQSNY